MEPNTVTIRTLRNDVAAVIKRVEGGESLDVTRHGERVARLVPLRAEKPMLTMGEFREMARTWKPDIAFLDELREMRSDLVRDPYERSGR